MRRWLFISTIYRILLQLLWPALEISYHSLVCDKSLCTWWSLNLIGRKCLFSLRAFYHVVTRVIRSEIIFILIRYHDKIQYSFGFPRARIVCPFEICQFVLVSWGKGLYTSTVICHWTRRVPLEGARILCYVLLVKKQLFHISKFMLVAFMYFSENLRVQKGNNF